MVAAYPYRYTSGDVIFTVFAERRGLPEHERAAARDEFYSKSQACLRSSELGKRYGWGIHADADGRIALVGVETPEYATFVSGRRRTASGDRIRPASGFLPLPLLAAEEALELGGELVA